MRVFRVMSYNGLDDWVIEKSQVAPEKAESDDNLVKVDKETYDGVDPVGSPENKVEFPRLQSDGSVVMEETGANSPPDPQTAMKEIVAYYASLNQDADDPTKAGRIQLNKFLSAYPGAQGPLQSGQYEELMGSGGYFEIAVEDSDLSDFDSAMRNDLEEIFRGETSYL